MKENWERAIRFVLKQEGGYVNNPNDPGGETKYGISKRAYPNIDIDDLSIEDAKQIYFRDYWQPIEGDLLPSPLDIIMFDTAVNMGVARAIFFKDISKSWQEFLFERLRFYASLKTTNIFLHGWVHRVLALYDLVKEVK